MEQLIHPKIAEIITSLDPTVFLVLWTSLIAYQSYKYLLKKYP